jgi:hypothetical protein
MGSFTVLPPVSSGRDIPWSGTISDWISTNGPTCFSHSELTEQTHLFAHRGALFYTPTENIPLEYIGTGDLDITVPLVTPDVTVLKEIPAYAAPRLWVDLLQQHSGKLRWTSILPARVHVTRYDAYFIRHDHVAIANKALLDSLKAQTFGRRDKKALFYFGAIVDDAPECDVDIVYEQLLIEQPKDARVRIQVCY